MSAILMAGKAVFSFIGGLVGNLIKYAAVFFAYRLGKKKAEAKAALQAAEHARQANEIDENVDHLPDDERERLLHGPRSD